MHVLLVIIMVQNRKLSHVRECPVPASRGSWLQRVASIFFDGQGARLYYRLEEVTPSLPIPFTSSSLDNVWAKIEGTLPFPLPSLPFPHEPLLSALLPQSPTLPHLSSPYSPSPKILLPSFPPVSPPSHHQSPLIFLFPSPLLSPSSPSPKSHPDICCPVFPGSK